MGMQGIAENAKTREQALTWRSDSLLQVYRSAALILRQHYLIHELAQRQRQNISRRPKFNILC